MVPIGAGLVLEAVSKPRPYRARDPRQLPPPRMTMAYPIALTSPRQMRSLNRPDASVDVIPTRAST